MKQRTRIAVFIIVAVLAVCFIAFGLLRGEAAVVLSRAVNICMECIGLGR